MLEKLGHEVQVAENGQVALERLKAFKPDAVLSDITMPVMGGRELARQIRKRSDFDSVCLVALTGDGESSDRELAFESGFDRHLTKTVDFQRLQDLFEELEISRLEIWVSCGFADWRISLGLFRGFLDNLLVVLVVIIDKSETHSVIKSPLDNVKCLNPYKS